MGDYTTFIAVAAGVALFGSAAALLLRGVKKREEPPSLTGSKTVSIRRKGKGEREIFIEVDPSNPSSVEAFVEQLTEQEDKKLEREIAQSRKRGGRK